MSDRPTILVTGATGAVGPRVVEAFRDAGHPTRALARQAPVPGLLPDAVDVWIGDVTDHSTVQTAMAGVDTVIHLAALLHIVDPPPSLRQEYQRINVGGTATVVEAAVQTRIRRVVFFSTIAVYGNGNGHILTEESQPVPDTFYAQTKRAAEEIVLNAKGRDGQPLGTVLRLGRSMGHG